jgi:heptosyltransferase-2
LRDPENILVLLPNWLGDVAMCTPALRALRRRFPGAYLTLAGRKAAIELLRGDNRFDRLETLPARNSLPAMIGAGRRLWPHARELAVVFPHSFRAALQARLAGARRVVGYNRGGRRLLLTDAIAPYRENGRIAPIYMAREYLDLVAPLGCVEDDLGLTLPVSPAERELLRTHPPFNENRPVVAIAPGAAFGPSKRWPPERFAAVIDQLHAKTGAGFVIVAGPGEEDVRDAILGTVNAPVHDAYYGHPSIARMKAVLAEADLVISNDTGPRHVAIAFDKPVICIMGSTSPRYTESPWERGEVLRIDVDCGPCQKPHCVTDHRCMTGIAPEQVVAAALRWMPAPKSPLR